MGLREYHKKRDFQKTSEPKGKSPAKKSAKATHRFVIQKHEASHLHYDFRLEMDGVLKSWAVPKGPSTDPTVKRLAMQVEDHPVEYGSFEGIIPEGEYGGGTVMLWDEGTWEPLEGSVRKQWLDGSMKIRLKGKRLKGAWALIRMKGERYGDSGKSWLLIKEKDDAVSKTDVTEKYKTSVATSRTMKQISSGAKSRKRTAKGGLHVWKDGEDQEEGGAKADFQPKKVQGAVKAAFPRSIKPQLATLVKSAPQGKEWCHEVKFDGYRFLVMKHAGKITMLTRNGKDWTDKFPQVVKALEAIPSKSFILDGELVALDEKGVSRFQLLQNTLKGDRDAELVYYAFDLLYLDGKKLTPARLEDRKAELLRLLNAADGKTIRYSAHFDKPGDEVWEGACRLGLEGIISKRRDAVYEQKRSQSWVKVKCSNRQEFVIGGFTKPTGRRKGLGALLVGLYDPQGKKLIYAGKVGTGFSDASLKELHGRLAKLERKTTPFENPPEGSWVQNVTWVSPELIGEVAFTEMTDEGLLRHPSFQGLREDKAAQGVIMEKAKPHPDKKNRGAKPMTSAKKGDVMAEKADDEVILTNPDRELFPEEEVTKQDLADYYEAVKDRAYVWMAERPLTLVRCPAGMSKPCFYQRHTKDTEIPGIEPVVVSEKGKKETYFYMAEPIALRALVQNSTLELHGWQCKVDDLDHPDRLIFDVDPAPDVAWSKVVDAARQLKKMLEHMGFTTFVMTTGGKGLHVVVPLKPAAGWDEVKGFAEAVARYLESTEPENYTANMSKAKRKGKVFVDYLRNGKTASAVLPYSTRAREGATVATPLTWKELTPKLDPKSFNIRTVPVRVQRQKQDPWADYEKSRVKLNSASVLKKLQGQPGE